MKVLAFIGLLILGLAAIYFAWPLYKITGSFESVEKFLGQGQTISFWRLIGVAIIVFAFVYLVYF